MKIDKNYKIKNLTPELSKRIQEICIAQGMKKTNQFNCCDDKIKMIVVRLDYTTFAVYEIPVSFEWGVVEDVTPAEFIAKFGEGENKTFRPEKKDMLLAVDPASPDGDCSAKAYGCVKDGVMHVTKIELIKPQQK